MMTHTDLFRACLIHGLGRKYGHSGPDSSDCVRLVADVLDDVLPGGLTPAQRRDILIAHDDPARPWSGIEALVQMGHREVHEPVCGRIHVCQRWRDLDDQGRIVRGVSRGHAFLFVGDVLQDVGLVIEATDRDHRWCWAADWYGSKLHPRGSQTRIVMLETTP